MSDRTYFGTDGIRGTVGDQHINAEFMLRLGWAAGKVLARDNGARVLMGRDTRVSGPVLQFALQAGLSAAGVDVDLVNTMSTPGIAYLTQALKASAGVVISASHNPYQDNGVKFFDSKGMKLPDAIEHEIEQQLTQPVTMVASAELGTVRVITDAAQYYIDHCQQLFAEPLLLEGMKLIVDCANGATYQLAPAIFSSSQAIVIMHGDQPDGFNINQHCGATDIKAMQQLVLTNQADIGIAFDGDGDRVMMVDETGELVDGDEILCILALAAVQDDQQGMGIVGTVMSNLGLEQTLAQHHIAFTRVKVGDRYVLEELVKRGWVLGGESSGHIINLNYATTGDGIITALQILRIMQRTGKSLHTLKQAMVKRPQVLINVVVKPGFKLDNHPEIAQAARDVEQRLSGQGRVLLRPSGTEPLIRVMVEGNERQAVQQAAESLAALVEQRMNTTNSSCA